MYKAKFDEWMRQVGAWIGARLGLTSADLPDCCYVDWYEDGMTPSAAARRAMSSANE